MNYENNHSVVLNGFRGAYVYKDRKNKLTGKDLKRRKIGMNRKKTSLMIAGMISLAALSSCGQSAPAATAAQTTEQTTTAAETTTTTTTTTADAGTEAPAAQSDRTDIPESEWDEYQDRIYAANQRAAVFKNHRSMTMESDFGIDPGEYKAYYNWFGENVTYYCAPAFEELSMPDVRYELLGIGSDWNPFATYYLDMIDGGYQFWPLPDDKNYWYDREHETLTAMYIQDGKVYTESVYDEAGTREYYNSALPQVEYTGGTLRYISVNDAETFEFIEENTYIENDGTSGMLIAESYRYDEPIPAGVNAMEGFFERCNINGTVTVTATSNPGTEKELTKSVTVPANSWVSFYTPDIEAPVYYSDYECTQPLAEQWDMMSDITVYIK